MLSGMEHFGQHLLAQEQEGQGCTLPCKHISSMGMPDTFTRGYGYPKAPELRAAGFCLHGSVTH